MARSSSWPPRSPLHPQNQLTFPPRLLQAPSLQPTEPCSRARVALWHCTHGQPHAKPTAGFFSGLLSNTDWVSSVAAALQSLKFHLQAYSSAFKYQHVAWPGDAWVTTKNKGDSTEPALGISYLTVPHWCYIRKAEIFRGSAKWWKVKGWGGRHSLQEPLFLTCCFGQKGITNRFQSLYIFFNNVSTIFNIYGLNGHLLKQVNEGDFWDCDLCLEEKDSKETNGTSPK